LRSSRDSAGASTRPEARSSTKRADVDKRRELSVVAPAYNEARRLPALIDRTAAADSWAAPASLSFCELIVVDDGSEDETVALLGRTGGLEGRLRILELGSHRGKGAAVRAGLKAASGDLVLLTDVDMSSPLDETAKLVAVLDDGFDLVIGSRAVPGAELAARQHPVRELLGKTLNRLLRLLTGLPFRDTQCGFKLFRAEVACRVAEHQRIEGYLYDAELCLTALQLGFRVAEVPVRWSHDADSRVRLLRSAPGVVLDLLRLRRLARRPPERQPERMPAPSVGTRR
jgi:dolichyl-phosphate beta-glucosyltransferase